MRPLATVRAPSAGERWVGFLYDADARAATKNREASSPASFRVSERVHGASRQDVLDQLRLVSPTVPQDVSYAAPPVNLGVTVHRKRGTKRKGVPFVDSKFDLYDIEMFDPISGALLRRKVGITASGDGRYAGVAATFGLGFRPRTQGVTYPNKASALEAEAILVRCIERDPQWVKVGKECFAPAKGD